AQHSGTRRTRSLDEPIKVTAQLPSKRRGCVARDIVGDGAVRKLVETTHEVLRIGVQERQVLPPGYLHNVVSGHGFPSGRTSQRRSNMSENSASVFPRATPTAEITMSEFHALRTRSIRATSVP